MKSVKNLFKKKDNYIIFCDMDGVLTDFDKAAQQLDPNIFKLPLNEMWNKIQNKGVEFWSDMDWIEGGKELWNYLIYYNPKLLTALPGLSDDDPTKHYASEGKKIWVRKNLGPKYLKRLILTTSPEKQKFANVNSILIDDTEKLINQWENNHGIGILHTNTVNTINTLKSIII